eukprot:PITA_32698
MLLHQNRDVTFDEDNVLGKARELPIPRKDNDDVAEKQDEPLTNEPMPNVDGPMDPTNPPPSDSSTSRKQPRWLKDTLKDVETHINPRGIFHEKAITHQVWKDVMNEEYESIMKNDVWDVVPRPKDKFVVTSKWIYKIKHGVDGSAKKYKAKFAARGFSQKEGVDYDEIFAPVAQYTTI